MDTKKLIGTIIGVTMFAVLIAGATFAWLTFGTTVDEANVTTSTTMNFMVDYTKGTAITNIPMVDSKLITPDQAESLVVVMKRNTAGTGSPDGHGYITLNTTTSDALTTDGVVRWAICRDTDIESVEPQIDDVCGSVTTPADFSAKALNTGKVTASGTIVLLNDAKLTTTKQTINVTNATTSTALQATGGSSTEYALLPNSTSTATNASSLIPPTFDRTGTGKSTATGVSYFIYFWLDGETINNTHKEKTYTGYIQAGANQLQT